MYETLFFHLLKLYEEHFNSTRETIYLLSSLKRKVAFGYNSEANIFEFWLNVFKNWVNSSLLS